MLRALVVLGVLVVIGGCQSFQQETPNEPAMAANPVCARIAAQRSQDAADNGQNSDVQRATFDEAYKGCVEAAVQISR